MLNFIKNIFIGRAKNPLDQQIFHNMSLIAFFAWIGLGADGLSSSCYGPEAAFLALGEHKYLSIFVALLSAATIFLISASYSQIIALFPSGGGGYLVASRLLSPSVGMVSGCALIIDYILTITISIASGADALFSFLPPDWQAHKLPLEISCIIMLMFLNMRGVKETILPLIPIFMTFIITHAFVIIYTIVMHTPQLPDIAAGSVHEVNQLHSTIGLSGIIFLILKSFSLGAGTFTGIEAVSNGLGILREPRTVTGKRTMQYMAWSLSITVVGLMLGYLLLNVIKSPDKTLNATLFEQLTLSWPAPWGHIFVLVTLLSETLLLFIAAQAGFIDGPRVLANMAVDRWAPQRFSHLSDRLVTQNGVVLMGISSLGILVLTHGSVETLVILYSINVFITFCLSQLGMVVHWFRVRHEEKLWVKKILINGFGLLLTSFILIAMVVLKFHEGGWITLAITSVLAGIAYLIKDHYKHTQQKLNRLSGLVDASLIEMGQPSAERKHAKRKTAIILVNGFNGLGLHTVFNVLRFFKDDFNHFVFLQIGVIAAGNFKTASEIELLKTHVEGELAQYVKLMQTKGYDAQSSYILGTDMIHEIENLTVKVWKENKDSIVFAGQLVFEQDSWVNRMLHNYTVFAVQRRLYHHGIPLMILPIRV